MPPSDTFLHAHLGRLMKCHCPGTVISQVSPKILLSSKTLGRAKQKQLSHFTWPSGHSSPVKSSNRSFSLFFLKPSISWVSKLLHDKGVLTTTTGTQIPTIYHERDCTSAESYHGHCVPPQTMLIKILWWRCGFLISRIIPTTMNDPSLLAFTLSLIGMTCGQTKIMPNWVSGEHISY